MSYRSVFKPGLFEGQTIVVTGGGSGIGRCTAHEIAALGAHVVITGRKPDKLAIVKDEIEAAGGSCETHAFDIREEAQVKEAVGKIVAGHGRIHGLFNNAGGQFPSPAAAHERQGLRRRGAQQPHRRLHRQPRGLYAIDGQARRLDRQHGGRHAQRLPQHGAHRRRARRHGEPHHDARLRMGACRRARERRVAGLDRLIRHGHLSGRVQGADPQAQGLHARSDASAPRARSRPWSAFC